MRIALAAAPVKNQNVAFNTSSMINQIHRASGKADVILFGESVLQGFDCLVWDYEIDRHMALDIKDAPILQLREAARESKIAVSFGFIECSDDLLYSSQIFIGADGEIVNVFHRVSIGWRVASRTDFHYREGTHFEKFQYGGKCFAIGLCGDLWTEGRPEEMMALCVDIVLWPVWCDYDFAECNQKLKHEYASQAALCGKDVLLVNPFCADPDGCAAGGCAHFQNGRIIKEQPAGEAGVLITDVK